MKIAILAHCLYPIAEPYAGGLEMITHQLCKSLKEKGHTVHLYAHKDSDSAFEIFPLEISNEQKTIDLSGVEQYLGEYKGIEADFIYQSAAYAKAINQIDKGSYDIVHNNSLHHFSISMGNMLSAPLITSFHTPPFPYLQMGTASVYGFCNQTFTTVSKKLGEIWSDFIESHEVVYNGIDVSKWKHTEKIEKEFENTAFWSGRMCIEKAPHHAIQAALKAGIKLTLAGQMSDEKYFEKEVKPLLDKNKESINYVGHINQEKINAYLCNSVASLFTSTWEEPYGLVLAESLACGTPVIAYNIGAAPEILTSKTGVLVEPNSIEKLAKAFKTASKLSRTDC